MSNITERVSSVTSLPNTYSHSGSAPNLLCLDHSEVDTLEVGAPAGHVGYTARVRRQSVCQRLRPSHHLDRSPQGCQARPRYTTAYTLPQDLVNT